ncbi:hypothetical protein, partial [Escherichia coli]
MPFKKLSRRTFLTASSALAFLHTLMNVPLR